MNMDRIAQVIKEQILRTVEQIYVITSLDKCCSYCSSGTPIVATPNLLKLFRAENFSQFSLRTLISKRPSFSYNRLF